MSRCLIRRSTCWMPGRDFSLVPLSMAMNELTIDRDLAERVHVRLLAAEAIARQLLEQHRDLHHEIATRLSAVGIVSGDTLREMNASAKGGAA